MATPGIEQVEQVETSDHVTMPYETEEQSREDQTMKTIERITDKEIAEISGSRKNPCIKSSGECYIITKLTLFTDGELTLCHDGEFITIAKARDINVFATEREAREWVAKMALDDNDACSSVKATYTIRCHMFDEDNI